MKRDHKDNKVGPWAEKKLEALEKYLNFYTTALKSKNFQLVYIDAFAGAPLATIRGSNQPAETDEFPLDADDEVARKEFVVGSPIRALNLPNDFDRLFFFDLDASRAETLERLKSEYNHPGVTVEVGDCNPLVRDLAKKLSARSIRGVAFLDPYGPHLEWATVEALAQTGTMEVIINFPVDMAINRLITRSNAITERQIELLNNCFGTTEWREVAYSVQSDLFGNESITKNSGVSEALLDLYIRRLKEIFPYVATPRLIRNTKRTPLYYLIWAGPNALGLKGADYILSQGEKVAKKVQRLR